MQVAAQIAFINSLEKRWIYDALEIKKHFSLSKEFIKSEKVQVAAQIAFINSFEKRWIYDELEIKRQFSLFKGFIKLEEVQVVLAIYLMTNSPYDNIDDFKNTINRLFKLFLVSQINKAILINLKEHIKDCNWTNANTIIKAIEENNVKLSKNDKIEISLFKKQIEYGIKKEEKLERKFYDHINLSEELVCFYGQEYVNTAIKQKEYELRGKEEGELTIKDQIFLNSQKRKLALNTEHNYDWIKVYLVRAVVNELRYVSDEIVFDVQLLCYEGKDINEFFTNITGEKMRAFFLKAIKIFNQKNWNYKFGGLLWANIAQLAYEFYLNDLGVDKKNELIDRSFQIEHNTGSVFNKDDKVQCAGKMDKQILDIVFKTKNLFDFEKEILELFKYKKSFFSIKQKIDEYKKALQTIEKIKIYEQGEGY